MRNQTQIFANKFDDLETATFDIQDYSKLKFGSNQAARRMGKELALQFFCSSGNETYWGTICYHSFSL